MPTHDYPPAPPGVTCQNREGFVSRCGKPAKWLVQPRDYSGEPLRLTPDGKAASRYAAAVARDAAEAPPVPMCGVHAAMHYRRHQEAVQREAHRVSEAERRKRVAAAHAVASNLATFLTEQLGVELLAVRPHGEPEGTFVLALDVESAQRIYSGQAYLTAPAGDGAGTRKWTAR